MLLLVLDCF